MCPLMDVIVDIRTTINDVSVDIHTTINDVNIDVGHLIGMDVTLDISL